MPGMLEKMKILAFQDDTYSKIAPFASFPVMVNPESYDQEYAVEYSESGTAGATEGPLKYKFTAPEVFSCQLVFDSTGIIDGIPRPDVVVEIEAFKRFLLGIDPEGHEPYHYTIIWGVFIFKGRVTSVKINYKLFSPDGRPIRATVDVSFKKSTNALLSIGKLKLLSPDLTKSRTVHAGDTLANLCYEMYGDLKHVMNVARYNNLTTVRYLDVGRELFFPPIKQERS